MAYNVYYCCDRCGSTRHWINLTVSLNRAVAMARRDGWAVGKHGWYCPKCRKKTSREEEPK